MKIIKTFTIILCLLIAAGAFGQTNDVNKPTSVSAKKESSQKENSVKTDSLTRDTKFLSIGDVYRIYGSMGDKITANQAKAFEVIMQEILNQAVAEYYDKQKQLPKK